MSFSIRSRSSSGSGNRSLSTASRIRASNATHSTICQLSTSARGTTRAQYQLSSGHRVALACHTTGRSCG
eukprot:1229537-Rhodomonas_salina.2